MSEAQRMMELTPQQREAAESTERSVAVVAGAGSGKTRVLIERLRRIVEEEGIDRFLAITFTEKAARELKQRLRPHLSPHLTARLGSAWIGTFHSIQARLLRAHAPLVELDPAFRILDQNNASLAIHEAVHNALLSLLQARHPAAVQLLETMEYRHATQLLSELMQFRWHAHHLFSSPGAADGAVGEVFRHAEKLLHRHFRRSGAIDFQELEIRALALLEKNPDVRKELARRFRHILVDEYQDTNDLQTTFIAHLFSAENRLFIVGDPRQSIYRFRGANVESFSKAVALITSKGGSRLTLDENFRSKPALLHFVNKVAEDIALPEAKLIPTRADDGAPAVIALSCTAAKETAETRRKTEAQAMAQEMLKLVESNEATFGDIACLFQAATSMSHYEDAFRAHGVPYRMYGGRRFLERPEVRDLTSTLAYAADPSDDAALIALLRSPLIGLSDDECVLMAGEEGKELRRRVDEHPKAKLLRALRERAPYLLPSQLMRFISDETGYEAFMDALDPSHGKRANIDQLIAMAEELEGERPITIAHFIAFIRDLTAREARLADAPAELFPDKAVRCMTVHASKGLEFPIVFLPDLARKSAPQRGNFIFVRNKGLALKYRDPQFPFGKLASPPAAEELLAYDQAQDEEESKRLLYVALTRARDKLYLLLHRDETIRGRWHRWLMPHMNDGVEVIDQTLRDCCVGWQSEPLRSSCTATESGNPTELGGRGSPRSRETEGTPRILSVSALETFERCPQEFYLKHRLELPALESSQLGTGDLPAQIKGSLVHSVLEELAKDPHAPLDRIITRELRAYHLSPAQPVIDSLIQLLSAFQQAPLMKNFHEGEHEVRFDWLFEGQLITGKIDWLRPVDDGYEIVDFKTDRLGEKNLAEQAAGYELQLIAYALAAEASGKRPVHTTTLAFLEHQESYSIAVDHARKKKGQERLLEIIRRIAAGDYEIGSLVPPCAGKYCLCPYHHQKICWLDQSPNP